MDILISADWKDDKYDLILVIVDQLTKMVYFKLIKVTIDVLGLANIIINIIVDYHKVLKSIIMDWNLLFTSKFLFSRYYFLKI